MAKSNEQIANEVDLALDRLASQAYGRREIDDRWRTVARYIDMARGAARSMMSEGDLALTQGE